MPRPLANVLQIGRVGRRHVFLPYRDIGHHVGGDVIEADYDRHAIVAVELRRPVVAKTLAAV